MVICILLLNHEIRSLSLAGLFEYVSVHYLKIEVAKYISSLLRIFKIALQTQQILWFNNQIQITMPLEQRVFRYNLDTTVVKMLFLHCFYFLMLGHWGHFTFILFLVDHRLKILDYNTKLCKKSKWICTE